MDSHTIDFEQLDQTAINLYEFMYRYDDEGPFEFINGEVIPVSPQIPKSAKVGFNLARRLADYADYHKLGTVFVEAPFVLTPDNPKWVLGSRVPDVMFYAQAKLDALAAQNPQWDDYPLVGPPDLAVEVLSKNDKPADLRKKAALYLQDGVRLVWLLDPSAQTVEIHAPDAKLRTLSAADTLQGADVLPALALPLTDIFGN